MSAYESGNVLGVYQPQVFVPITKKKLSSIFCKSPVVHKPYRKQVLCWLPKPKLMH